MSITRARRWRVQYPVQVVSQDFVDEARTVDVSLRGLSLETTQSICKGTELYVRLLLPGRTSSVDYEICRVQWAADGRIGLETTEMRTAEEQRLHRHLSSLTGFSDMPVPATNPGARLDQPMRQTSVMGLLRRLFLKPLSLPARAVTDRFDG